MFRHDCSKLKINAPSTRPTFINKRPLIGLKPDYLIPKCLNWKVERVFLESFNAKNCCRIKVVKEILVLFQVTVGVGNEAINHWADIFRLKAECSMPWD